MEVKSSSGMPSPGIDPGAIETTMSSPALPVNFEVSYREIVVPRQVYEVVKLPRSSDLLPRRLRGLVESPKQPP
jgi:hypothetical protein